MRTMDKIDLDEQELTLITNLVSKWIKKTKLEVAEMGLEKNEFSKVFTQSAFMMADNLLNKLKKQQRK